MEEHARTGPPEGSASQTGTGVESEPLTKLLGRRGLALALLLLPLATARNSPLNSSTPTATTAAATTPSAATTATPTPTDATTAATEAPTPTTTPTAATTSATSTASTASTTTTPTATATTYATLALAAVGGAIAKRAARGQQGVGQQGGAQQCGQQQGGASRAVRAAVRLPAGRRMGSRASASRAACAGQAAVGQRKQQGGAQQGCAGSRAARGCKVMAAAEEEKLNSEVPAAVHEVFTEYKDIMPDDLLAGVPAQIHEHQIVEEPGAKPVSRAPYRLSPTEMTNMKK
ncbi:unnamed protein product [Closterium sp. NIES-54]